MKYINRYFDIKGVGDVIKLDIFDVCKYSWCIYKYIDNSIENNNG